MEGELHKIGQMPKQLHDVGVSVQTDTKTGNAEFAAVPGFLKLLIREVPALHGLRIIIVPVINVHIAEVIQAIIMINVHIATSPIISIAVW